MYVLFEWIQLWNLTFITRITYPKKFEFAAVVSLDNECDTILDWIENSESYHPQSQRRILKWWRWPYQKSSKPNDENREGGCGPFYNLDQNTIFQSCIQCSTLRVCHLTIFLLLQKKAKVRKNDVQFTRKCWSIPPFFNDILANNT